MFEATVYSGRRRRLCQQLKSGLVLLFGNEEAPRNSDVAFDFRQDSNFLYFFGLDYPGLAGVIDVDENRDIVAGDELTIDQIVFMGPQPTLAARSAAAGVQQVIPAGQLQAVLAKAVRQGRRIHFLPPYQPDVKLKLLDLLGLAPAAVPTQASVELIRAVVEQRSIKTAEEIAEIEQAVNLSVDMHRAVIRMARPGMREAELAAEARRWALAANGDVSFPVILTINGQILHNNDHSHALQSGDMVLCDCGAEMPSRYVADLTTTFPVDRHFTPRQRDVYAIMLAAYDAAVAALKPGVRFKDIHLMVCKMIAAGMRDLGLMKGNLDDAVAAGAHAMFFPCGLGHMMGLDPHDMEELGGSHVGYEGQPKSTQFGLKSLRMARPLQPGIVMTVEPGVYFIPELMDLWRSQGKCLEFINYEQLEAYRHLGGLRTEENHLITATGARRLGVPKPRTVAEIEALRGA